MTIKSLEDATLSSRFRLERQLGRGGYGSVFEAEQLSMGRRCAVKVLSPKAGQELNTEERFSQEARTTSRLTHPNSIVIYDFGRDDAHDVFWLAMELLDGETLQKRVSRDGPMSVERCLHIVRQVAESLAEAHQIGLVHRDIKPGNIMLLDRGGDADFVKVIDFGIAKVVRDTLMPGGNMTQTGRILGTPKYMAPEQIRDTTVDGRADMYALATVVYAMLTRKVPFSTGTAMEIASRQLTERPPKIRDLAPSLDVGPRFEAVLLQALAKDPNRRFESILGFVDALEDAALTGQTETPMPVASDDTEQAADDTAPSDDAPVIQDISIEGPVLAETADEVAATTQPMREGMTPTAEVGRPDAPATMATLAVEQPGTEDVTVDTVAVSSELDSTIGSDAPPEPGLPAKGSRDEPHWVRWLAIASVACVIAAAGVWFAVGGDDQSVAPQASASVESASAAEGPSEPPPEVGPGVVYEEAVTEQSGGAPNEEQQPAHRAERVAKKDAGVEHGASAPTSAEGDAGGAEDAETEPRRRRVTIRAIPWGEIFVDGRSLGRGSKFDVTVIEGPHEFMLKQNDDVRARRTVDVSARSPRIIELVAD